MKSRKVLELCAAIALLVCAAAELALVRAGDDDAADTAAARVGTIVEKSINEASGIAASRQFPGIYWTHNDGHDGVLFAVHRDGSFVGSASIDAKVRDWEDVAVDENGNLYIADTGNNTDKRDSFVIYEVREPDPAALGAKDHKKLNVSRSWKIELPPGRPDIESFFTYRKFGYIITKMPEGVAADVYRFDLESREPKLEKVGTLPVDRPVTSASISIDGKELAVLARGMLWIFEIDGEVAAAAKATPRRIALPPIHAEGCCFGKGEIVIVAESGEILAVPWKNSPTTTQRDP